jgi:hypothetical protein
MSKTPTHPFDPSCCHAALVLTVAVAVGLFPLFWQLREAIRAGGFTLLSLAISASTALTALYLLFIAFYMAGVRLSDWVQPITLGEPFDTGPLPVPDVRPLRLVLRIIGEPLWHKLVGLTPSWQRNGQCVYEVTIDITDVAGGVRRIDLHGRWPGRRTWAYIYETTITGASQVRARGILRAKYQLPAHERRDAHLYIALWKPLLPGKLCALRRLLGHGAESRVHHNQPSTRDHTVGP